MNLGDELLRPASAWFAWRECLFFRDDETVTKMGHQGYWWIKFSRSLCGG
jgi:hypothetical protein